MDQCYASNGIITNPGKWGGQLASLPTDIAALVKTIQGLVVHVHWAERYGLKLSAQRRAEVQLRKTEPMLQRILELDARPLTELRPLEKRLAGNCRDFSTLLCSILRSQGVPARARCGFATYFWPEKYEDHWVCEYWRQEEGRWILVDAQIDALQQQVLGIDFDTLDVPRDKFVVAGKAWYMCRQGGADPGDFGIFDMRGLWFIRGNLVRDIAALNKMELLPWDSWGLADCRDEDLTPDDCQLLDKLAQATMADPTDDELIRKLYEDDRIRVPAVIKSYTEAGPVEVVL